MLICLCKAVSDRDLRQAIGRGCRSVSSLCDKTGAGSSCGSCKIDLHAMLKDARINPRSLAAGTHRRQG
ncbi:MAG: (2Fe-2S)-binding protein [Myxococcota bacterium]|jgi:bacterioferritin-associated ferredoxin|nr:(2Fe-2S)-binding protein [Myxococcota bacterium]